MRPHFSVILNKALQDKALSVEEGYTLINCADEDVPAVLATAGELRDRHKGRTVTYSRKVFLPITNLCRDRCSYCTFRKDPRDPDAWTMTPEEVLDWVERGKAQGCKEALMCLGDIPNPVTGKPEPDLAAVRELIDIISMLQEKTRGKLDAQEGRLFEKILFDLRMRFVEKSRK